MFVDSHCHLEGSKYDPDRLAVIERAHGSGVVALLAIGNGNSPYEADCSIRLAEEFDDQAPEANVQRPARDNAEETPASRAADRNAEHARRGPLQIYASVGIHPHEAKLADDAALLHLATLARHPRVIACGEIGLDYWYDFSPREAQRLAFHRQLELARAAKKPVVIHCRTSKDSNDAWDDTLEILRKHWAPHGLGGIMHCFSGGMEQARVSLDMGFLVSFAGNITFPKAEDIRAVARQIPLDRMLIETDSPYLAPVPHRGKRNEPAFVTEVARRIGELRSISPDEVGQRTSETFFRFFGLQQANE
jgi:TatD DNase family protein